jgi:hypothetical protein
MQLGSTVTEVVATCTLWWLLEMLYSKGCFDCVVNRVGVTRKQRSALA